MYKIVPGQGESIPSDMLPKLSFRKFTMAASNKPPLASLVGALRAETGQSLSLCRKALEATGLDLCRARTELTKLVQAQAEGTQYTGQQRQKNQGVIGLKRNHDGSARIVELRCVSDFVARNPIFVGLAEKLLQSLPAGANARLDQNYIDSDDTLRMNLLDAVGRLKEPITVGHLEIMQPAKGEVIGAYVHQPILPGFGSIAAIAKLGLFENCPNIDWAQKLADNLAKHVAGMNPLSVEMLLTQDYLFDPSRLVSQYLQDSAASNDHQSSIEIINIARISLKW